MATSGNVAWKLQRDDIITEAMENIGVLELGGTPSSTELTSATRSLNLLCKSLQADPSIALRFIDSQTVSLVDGTGSYDLEADTMKVMDCWLRISGNDTHLDIVSRDEYDLIVGKSAEGQPLKVYIDYSPSTPKAYFYPVPDTSYTAHIVHERRVEDFDSATDDADFPIEATDMIVYGLCFKLSSKYVLPLDQRMYWEKQFELAKREFRAGDTNRYGREIVAPNFVV